MITRVIYGMAVIAALAAVNIPASSAAAAEEITFSYNSDWPPFSYGAGKTVKGILPSLMDEIVGRRMGLTVSHHGSAWKRAQLNVERGKLDGFITVPTDKRLQFATRSKSIVYRFEMRAVTKTGTKADLVLQQNNGIEAIRRFKVCDIVGNGWGQNFFSKHKVPYVTASNLAACIRILNKERVDVSIQSTGAVTSELAANGLSDKIKIHPKIFGGMDFALMVSKKSSIEPAFLEEFDRTVGAMIKDGSYDKLIDRLRRMPVTED